mgnify:CR=1 FL=1
MNLVILPLMVAAAHAAGVSQAPAQVAVDDTQPREGKRESHDTIIHFMLE